ncbi:MAG: addiction module protein [Verrucomicrobia bacterium]|nr:addiction module protein [Verrucomicrobiota bacterium]
MTAHAKKIVADALRLDREARAALMERLILSLDDGPRDKDAGAGWLKTVAQRRKEIRAGRAVLVAHEDMMREAWSQLHAARRHAS